MFLKVRLNTRHMYDNADPKNKDYLLHKKIAEFMHDEIAIVSNPIEDSEKFHFLCLTDTEKDKELAYMMEQDSVAGCFVDNRKEFEEAYNSGTYNRDVTLVLDPEYVVVMSDERTK